MFKSRDRHVHGQSTQPTDGTLEPQTNVINATNSMSRKQGVREYQTQYFFKYKPITQSTLTQADTIDKTINNLTHNLKGRKNLNGKAQIES
jgi:hypothetical protein